MVNPEIINERLEEIQENIALLEELKATPEKQFCNDPKIFKLAERCLEISIQAFLDIAHHIIVGNNWQRPQDNKEAIATLAKRGVIPLQFAKTILPLAGLRNILAHEYLKVNPSIIYKHIKKLDDFRKLEKHITAYLKKLH